MRCGRGWLSLPIGVLHHRCVAAVCTVSVPTGLADPPPHRNHAVPGGWQRHGRLCRRPLPRCTGERPRCSLSACIMLGAKQGLLGTSAAVHPLHCCARLQFNSPVAIAARGTGELYVADTKNHVIRLLNMVTFQVTTVAGTGGRGNLGDGGPPLLGEFARTAFLVERLDVYSTAGLAIYRCLLAHAAMFNEPQGVAVRADGLIAIADTLNCRIRVRRAHRHAGARGRCRVGSHR